jgi:hypothetical protein
MCRRRSLSSPWCARPYTAIVPLVAISHRRSTSTMEGMTCFRRALARLRPLHTTCTSDAVGGRLQSLNPSPSLLNIEADLKFRDRAVTYRMQPVLSGCRWKLGNHGSRMALDLSRSASDLGERRLGLSYALSIFFSTLLAPTASSTAAPLTLDPTDYNKLLFVSSATFIT